MIEEVRLRVALQRLLRETEASIRERLADEPTLAAQLHAKHAAAVAAGRTAAGGYHSFEEEAITQAAVHWLLGCVFVRFLEDNGWLDGLREKVAWLAGPNERMDLAKQQRTLLFRQMADPNDRDYLLHVFAAVAQYPGMAALFDYRHNPIFSLGPTAQGANRILDFFQQQDPDTGKLMHDFTDEKHQTRFLGDLYQNLSESARKRYALCQTPGFVIDFILDRTLTPALDTFGLEVLRLIDPSCGSGHFLLAAFYRLFRLWQQREPGTNPPVLAQRTLDAVAGVDLNPFAVAITKFRLLIAALEACGIARLKEAPEFRFEVTAADALLHGSRPSVGGGVQRDLFDERLQFFYEVEDAHEAKRILSPRYHVVVGNPPYINVSDPVLRDAYRTRFLTCHGQYQLGVPFTERFFDLTVRGEYGDEGSAGWMGMIVSNAFMKRGFGKKLIEDYLRHRDLTHVIDTSGAYLPGHGTPTTILFGQNRRPLSSKIRALRGIRGESGVPEDPANAPVWREIADQVDQPGFEGLWVSVADAPRESFANHPWSIGGGGTAELKAALDKEARTILQTVVHDIGVIGRSSADEAFAAPDGCFERRGVPKVLFRCQASGESLRDWQSAVVDEVLFPYGSDVANTLTDLGFVKWVWPCRTKLGNRMTFSQKTYFQEGRDWWGWHQVSLDRLNPKASIVWGEIATHNHFVLDRGGKVFNQTAPVIKLPPEATEDQHLELLGLLNSSTACFWLKQICFPKGGDTVGQDGARVRKLLWDVYYAFDSTKLKQFPIPDRRPLTITRQIQAEVDARSLLLPERLCAEGPPTREQLDSARQRAAHHLARMIALQEELDWECYRLYGILDEDLTLPADQIPNLALGERAFEIVMAREGREPVWFERHRSTPIRSLPEHWPARYRQLVERRIAGMSQNRDLALIEQPEYKRRWNLPTWEELEQEALRNWLLDRMEAAPIWQQHRLVSAAQLRDALAQDPAWMQVAALFRGGAVDDLEALVIDLAVREAVPFLPVQRYTETGLRKRAVWEETWSLQRLEDAGEKPEIPVPPKYVAKDFQKPDYWRLRGGLDVPKERFILYPALERDSDRSPVLGWAGWNHLQQAMALGAYYQHVKMEEGWDPKRLVPVLGGLLELGPWLLQWHNEFDPEMGEKLGDFYVRFAKDEGQQAGYSPAEIRAWQPPVVAPRRLRTRNS
jgi:hypothetical protein